MFRRIGGAGQLALRDIDDLPHVLELDEAHWALTGIDIDFLRTDRQFLDFIDEDHNGIIQADEVKRAVAWFLAHIRPEARPELGSPELRLDSIDVSAPEGAALFAAEKGVRTTVFGNRADIIVFGKGTFCAEKRDGCALSVLSLTDKSEGVTVSGVKYPLQNAVLTSDFPLGISNEWTAPQTFIEVKKGVLAVIISSLQSENK